MLPRGPAAGLGLTGADPRERAAAEVLSGTSAAKVEAPSHRQTAPSYLNLWKDIGGKLMREEIRQYNHVKFSIMVLERAKQHRTKVLNSCG